MYNWTDIFPLHRLEERVIHASAGLAAAGREPVFHHWEQETK